MFRLAHSVCDNHTACTHTHTHTHTHTTRTCMHTHTCTRTRTRTHTHTHTHTHTGSTLQQQHQTTQQQQQTSQQQAFTFGHSLQGLPMQMYNDTLQRRMLQQNTFWLGGSAIGTNSILPDTTRQLVLQQQQQQSHGQPQQVGGSGEVGVPRQNLVGPPILHSLNSTSIFPQSLSNQSHQAQLLSVQRANATSGRVRAPISPIPSGIPIHEALQRNLPPPGSGVAIQPSLFGQSSLHGKQGLTAAHTQLSSQQVT